MSIVVTIQERNLTGGTVTRQRKAFRGRKRNNLLRLRTSLERVIRDNTAAAVAVADGADPSLLVFSTTGQINQANTVLQRVNDALSR